MAAPFSNIHPIQEKSHQLHVIIDTPKGSRNKFSFDEDLQVFKLKHVLPEGAVFPFDFGFLPNTIAEDGDPLDVMVLMDAPAFAGCLIEARAIGVIEAEQTDSTGKTSRNDRLLAVSVNSRLHQDHKNISDLSAVFLDEIEHFFRSYNQLRQIDFKVLARSGPDKALALVREGIRKAR
ncbi:MAG TPA: inorganic diphosphatase [Adhaeribacter sp.]|nr:inorganic diphosphatase [Adhaeribacter sp.]